MSIYIVGNLGKMLSGLIKPLAQAIAKALEFAVEPIVKILITVLNDLIMPIIDLLMKIALLGVEILTRIIMQFIAGVFMDLVGNILVLITLTPQMIDTNTYILSAINTMQLLAIASLTLMGTYYGFKSFFAYFGFESEEPWKLMIRGASTIFIIMAAPDICRFFLGAYREIELIIYNIFGLADGRSMGSAGIRDIGIKMFEGAFDPIGLILNILCFVVIFVKSFKHLAKIAERYILVLILVVVSPLACACSFAKPLRHFFQNWIKFFTGTLAIQGIQVIAFSLMAAIARNPPADFNFLGSEDLGLCLLILGCFAMIDIAEKIVTSIGGMSSGIDSSGGAFAQIASYGYNATTGAIHSMKNMNAQLTKAAAMQNRKDLMEGISHLKPKSPRK